MAQRTAKQRLLRSTAPPLHRSTATAPPLARRRTLPHERIAPTRENRTGTRLTAQIRHHLMLIGLVTRARRENVATERHLHRKHVTRVPHVEPRLHTRT